MRNSLAEDVLNKDMLHVMRCYAASLNDSDHLKSTISLLEQTSILIANCRDRRPIREVGDIRLMENDKVLNWFCEWESEVLNNDQVKDKKNFGFLIKLDLIHVLSLLASESFVITD